MRRLMLLALLLSGCADYKGMRADMASDIAGLTGQNIEAAIGRLGIPSANHPLGNTTVYTWVNDNVFVGTSDDESPLKCELRLRVSANGTILSGDFDGNNGACMALRNKLRGGRRP